jgi:archaellum component FlaC
LEACKGESLGIALRDPALVKIAQEKTVYFSNGTMIDASKGVAEFEGPNNIMSELFSLPARVTKLENEMVILTDVVTNLTFQIEKISPEIQKLSKQVEELLRLFSQPKLPDEKIDVT